MHKATHKVYLAFGSNLGDRRGNIWRALKLLEERGLKPAAVSSFIETMPEGFSSDNKFVNAAACFDTLLKPRQVLEVTQQIERELGRTEKSSDGVYHDRTIDIDILFYDDIVFNAPDLKIPHPLIAERFFVLKPLAEIAPKLKSPVSGNTIAEMLSKLEAE